MFLTRCLFWCMSVQCGNGRSSWFSHILTYPTLHFIMCRLVASACHYYLSSGISVVLFYHVISSFTRSRSPSQIWSAPISLSTYCHLKKGSFYIAQYPVRWTAHSALHFFLPWQTCSFRCRHQPGFSGKHSSHADIRRLNHSHFHNCI